MRDFILGFVAFPLVYAVIPPVLAVTEPAFDYLSGHPLLLFPLSVGVMLLFIDWDWKRTLFNRYAEWKWERKQRLLKRLQRELGGQ